MRLDYYKNNILFHFVPAALLCTALLLGDNEEATLELEQRAALEVARVLTGRMPDNLVNPAVLSHPNPRHRLPAATG